MTLKNGDFIRLDYTERVDEQVIASTEEEVAKESGIYDAEQEWGPRLVLIGSGQVLKGLEEDLIGKDLGYSGSVEIPPEKAFGIYDPKQFEFIPANKFKENKPLPGVRVSVNGKMGTITRILGRKVGVDFNHPLADKTVKCDYKVLGLIEDRLEKLKAMIKTFARLELEARLVEDAAEIEVPWEISYYKEWVMIRRGLADMILQHLELKEVRFIERHTGGRVKAELISPPGREAAAEPSSEPTESTESPSGV